jgi:hypothetical protein
VAFLCLAACAVGVAEDEMRARVAKKAAEMPRIASSADGFVEVVAADVPGDSMGFRLPLLRFTTQLIGEVERAYGLEMPRADGAGLVIRALDGQTNDVRVISRRGRRDGRLVTRIYLPSPGFSSIEALRLEIVQAYLRAWADRSRPDARGGGAAAEPPGWLAFGVLRARTADGADDDIRFVLEQWSEHVLPPFPKFCLDLRIATMQDAAYAGYLVAWMKEKGLFRAALERLAAGRAWSQAELLADLTGEKGEEGQRHAFNARLERLSRAVLSPGRASAWDIKNFRRQLRLDVKPVEGEPEDAVAQNCSFRRAIKLLADRPAAVRAAAFLKMRELPLYAVRRGRRMAAVSEAYSEFLVMLSRGTSADRLNELLDKAEHLLAQLATGGDSDERGGDTASSAPQEDKVTK